MIYIRLLSIFVLSATIWRWNNVY